MHIKYCMALYNISVDMVVAESAAETEPAWENAGTAVGLQIWRIVVSRPYSPVEPHVCSYIS